MDLEAFGEQSSGALVPIVGTDKIFGEWKHQAFAPEPLPTEMPTVSNQTFMRIADARAALAALDSTAAQLERPALLRQPTLRREAQSTSALEGTYAPLSDVLAADEQDPGNLNMREILNYVEMAEYGYSSILEGRPLTVGLLCELQEMLVRRTKHEGRESGQIRTSQVVVGQRANTPIDQAPVYRSRYVPMPPGDELQTRLRELIDWMNTDHTGRIDPVAASGMAHYQFETLHPFHDGNGRIGRLLMTMQLLRSGTLREPTLTVSPWFEARRTEYYDGLLAVSTETNWDGWLGFYATGIADAALSTRQQMLDLVAARQAMVDRVKESALRAGTAFSLVDYAVARLTFTVRQVERDLGVSYARANKLVEQLMGLGILEEMTFGTKSRRFFAPLVFEVLTRDN